MKARLFTLCLCLAVSIAMAQKTKTITARDKIVFATVDRPGDLYVVTSSGQIQKFNSDGSLVSEYKDGAKPNLFDARDGSRLFVYFREDQQYAYLNPTFEVTVKHKVDPSLAIKPWLVCASGDHNIWILDAEDKTIKRINTSTSGIDAEIELTDVLDEQRVTYMREYQGFLFVLDVDKGIRIFSSMGKPLMILGYPGLTSFNFFGEELYYVAGNTVKLFNLFTTQTREIPLLQKGEIILITDVRLFSIRDQTVDIIPFTH